jgi:hypothetical protein
MDSPLRCPDWCQVVEIQQQRLPCDHPSLIWLKKQFPSLGNSACAIARVTALRFQNARRKKESDAMVDDADNPDDVPFVSTGFSNPPARPLNPAIFEDPQSGSVPAPLRDQPETQGTTADHVALEARGTAMSAGSAQFTLTSNAPGLTVTPARRLIVGKVVIANKAAIYFQALQLELQIEGRIVIAREERSNSESVEELEALKQSVAALRTAISEEATGQDDEAGIGAKALSIKDGLLNWWTKDHVTILDRAYNMSLFAGGLGLCCASGILPAITVGVIIRGKEITDALKAGVDLLKSVGSGD